MEGKKRVVAAAMCCILIVLSGSGQKQVAGSAGFCGCFGSCYPRCREGHPVWLCTMMCVESCAVDSHEVPPVAVFGAGDCSKICLASICGTAETSEGPADAGAAAACVDDCTENWKRYKNKHT